MAQCENKLCKGPDDGTFKWSMDISIEVQHVSQMLPAGLISSNRINSVACDMQEIIVQKWMVFPLCSMEICKFYQSLGIHFVLGSGMTKSCVHASMAHIFS